MDRHLKSLRCCENGQIKVVWTCREKECRGLGVEVQDNGSWRIRRRGKILCVSKAMRVLKVTRMHRIVWSGEGPFWDTVWPAQARINGRKMMIISTKCHVIQNSWSSVTISDSIRYLFNWGHKQKTPPCIAKGEKKLIMRYFLCDFTCDDYNSTQTDNQR